MYCKTIVVVIQLLCRGCLHCMRTVLLLSIDPQ